MMEDKTVALIAISYTAFVVVFSIVLGIVN